MITTAPTTPKPRRCWLQFSLRTMLVLLSRHPAADDARWRHVAWDARTLGDWVGLLDRAAALVNLAGRTVDCVKTPDHCDEILGLGAPLMMRTDPELAIYGRYCVSRRLAEEGFSFAFPDVASALRDVYSSWANSRTL
jgi:hypothetical protein